MKKGLTNGEKYDMIFVYAEYLRAQKHILIEARGSTALCRGRTGSQKAEKRGINAEAGASVSRFLLGRQSTSAELPSCLMESYL